MRPKSRSSTVTAAMLAGLILCTIIASAWSADAPNEEWKAPARAARKKNPIPADEKSMARGEAVYVKECASCHGDSGKGDGKAAADLNPKPRDLRTPKIWEQTDGSLFWKLTEGKKPMPSYDKTLGEEDRWHVINYIHKFAPKDAGRAPQQ
jgi:mono/diheme cytochrome c family protein